MVCNDPCSPLLHVVEAHRPTDLGSYDPQQALPDLTSPDCALPAVRGLSRRRLVSLEGPGSAPASHPPVPVYRWQKGVPRAESHPRSLSTDHITFEEDKSSISPFIGCIYAGGQALPELLDLHGVTLLHPVIAQTPEPAILGVKEERKGHSL